MPKPKNAPTGGQINVAGILYQMLVSLADGLETTVSEYSRDESPSPIILRVEPFDGGDVQIDGPQRVVIQVKTRAQHLRWTTGAIVTKILSDLYQAVGSRQNDRYQIATDNDAGCEEFTRFLRWFRSRKDPAARPEDKFRLGRGGKRVTAEELLQWIADTLDPNRTNDVRIGNLLGSLEIVKRSGFDVGRAINHHLTQLVEKPEDVRHKRKQLVGELMELGSVGNKISTSQLLDRAGLDPRRLIVASLIPKILKNQLLSRFKAIGYVSHDDVRRPLDPPTRPITVLTGESGLGKTWQLCALAKAMMDAGKLVILLRATMDLAALRASIAAAIWNPIYSNVAPLSSVAERLRSRFKDSRDVWLTVFLDDLNDPQLAQRLVEDDWASLGIDIITSCQPPTADWLRRCNAAPDMIEVPGFNIDQLIRYLAAHGVQYAEVADDVLDLLFKPVLARLFCLLPHGGPLRAETEYELLNSFWVNATTERASQVRHPFDLDRLQLLVGDMLSAPAAYPWPPSTFVRTLSDDTVFRLMDCGIVELDGDRRLSMTHDRLLNWAMAAHLVGQAVETDMSSTDLVSRIQQVEDLSTVTGVNIGRRLNYVLMDLLWLMLGPGRRPPARIADFLLANMRTPNFDPHDQDFFRRMLPTLGARAVPLLNALAKEGFSGNREMFWPAWIADAFRKVADIAWNEVRASAVELFRSGEGDQIDIALRVIAKVGAEELIDQLFALTMKRKITVDGAPADNRLEAIRSKQLAFDALARSVERAPAWLDDKIAQVAQSDEAEQLLWVLTGLDRRAALPIWQTRREHLFQVIPVGARVLPKAIRTFAELDDLHLLELPSPESAEHLHGAVTFDAIARLDPDRALEILRSEQCNDVVLDLRGTDGWWMPGLFHRTGAKVASALRERARHNGNLASMQQLALLYSGAPEFIDPETVDIILDTADATLSKESVSKDEQLRELHWLLSLLSSLQTSETIDRLVARRDTHFERALTDLAIGREPSSSRIVDHEGEMIARILAIIAGEGYDQLVFAQIDSPGRTTAEYGLGHALWTPSEAVGTRLEQLVTTVDEEGDGRPYHLMQALAAHGRDAGLARLIQDNTPIYNNAVSIWQARSGNAAALIEQVNAKMASADIEERAKAVDMSHFLEADISIALTMPLIASATPGDMVASRLLMLHFHRERYEPALLPKIVPFLSSSSATGSMAAFHLASHGDAHGRAAAIGWLGEHGLEETQYRSVETALGLLEYDDSRDGAISFLRRLRDRETLYWRHNTDILDALATHGDEKAAKQLEDLAFASKSKDMNAVASAVRIVSRMNSEGAFQAARRLFVKSSQLETAKIVMDTDPVRGVAELLKAYVGANLPKRLAIARTLRWGAPSETLFSVLSALATSASAIDRKMAAEIGGWLSHAQDIQWLSELTADPVQSVEIAALEAVRLRGKASAARELMAAIPSLAKPRQWAYMRTVIDMVDPHLITHVDDPLCLRSLLDTLPKEFAIEAQQLIDRRRKDVARKEAATARKEE
ncbi:hypothetical protein HFO55_25270 [Rhizobium leguminosarum]|uniref:hypothetical protein n=1 Tax=Rhizobium leguminosarum TaxID=384 RepID=UPI001C96E930|nr:hypothetical protein [Rhizobium leguminosarum]MBY5570521.1 hypothetical protein [Rhizobium leguminosarum]MBY5576994.1 hypothetical protein [Rhizobium leguminosarum]